MLLYSSAGWFWHYEGFSFSLLFSHLKYSLLSVDSNLGVHDSSHVFDNKVHLHIVADIV